MPQDISQWNKTKEEIGEIDLLWNSSPCQDISSAGKQAGAVEGSGTRSSLVYEVLRIAKEIRPKYVIWENVKNLTSKKHKPILDDYMEKLNELGYTSHYRVLNAKDYGIPQNRERVFVVSIRNDINNYFIFPKSIPLNKNMKSMLETNVDDKYYLSNKMIDYISATGTAGFRNPDCKINLDIARPITTAPNKRAGTTNYICDNLPANYDLQTIKSGGIFKEYPKIRRLTPKECWRLMGFDDEDFKKASTTSSDTQLYKQAGNSIVVNVIEAIFDNLLKDYQ